MNPVYERIDLNGIVLDLPPEEVPEDSWTDGINVHFKDTSVERVGGYDNYAEPLPDFPNEKPRFLLPVVSGDIAYWMYCTDTEVYVTDGSTHYHLTKAITLSAAPVGAWTGTSLNGVPVINNQVDIPYWWDGDTANDIQPLPDWDSTWRCKAIRSFKYHLFALHMTEGVNDFPYKLRWSHAADAGSIPSSWTPEPANQAGDTILSDQQGSIVDAALLRDNLVIYQRFNASLCRYVAGQYIFAFSKLFTASGVQATNCVAEYNGRHYVMTDSDVISHDGNVSQSVVTWKIKNALIDSIDGDNVGLCQVSMRKATDELWLCIPEQGNDTLTRAYVLNLITGHVGVRSLPNVHYVSRGLVTPDASGAVWDDDDQPWDDDVTTWNEGTSSNSSDSFMMADYDGARLLTVDTSDTNDGENVAAYVERIGLDLGDWTKNKLALAIYPRISGADGDIINIRVGGQRLFNDPVDWYPPQEFEIGRDVYVPVNITFRYLAIRFEAATAHGWKLHQFTIKYTEEGIY